MAESTKAERQYLSAEEAQLIAKTHFPTLGEISDEELQDVARQIQDSYAGLRAAAAELRRNKRAKAPKAEAGEATPGATGSLRRKQILAKALVRLKREIDRRDTPASRRRTA